MTRSSSSAVRLFTPRIAQIEGALGEDSPFHRTHRVYGDGVDATTATLPPGWENRLVRAHRLNEVTLIERLGSVKLLRRQRETTHARLAALTGLDVESIIADLST